MLKEIKNFVSGLFSPTPKKAKKVRNIATTLVVVAGALWTANKIEALPLSPSLLSACQLITVIGGAIGLTAQSKKVK